MAILARQKASSANELLRRQTAPIKPKPVRAGELSINEPQTASQSRS